MKNKRQPKRLWCVMKAHGWHTATAGGIALQPPAEGPHGYIPVFNTREQAVAWAGGAEHVFELEARK